MNTKSKKNNSGFAAVVAVVVLLVVAGLGAYFVMSKQKADQLQTTSSKPTISDSTTTEPTSQQNQKDQSKQVADENNFVYTNTTYGFEFMHPKEWGVFEPSTISAPALFAATTNPQDISRKAFFRVTPIASFTVGGAFGAELKYSPVISDWVVSKQGRIEVSQAVGEVFPLKNTTNKNNVKVYTFNTGDGPYSDTSLLFIKNSNIVQISLPSVCADPTCTDYQNSYNMQQVADYANYVASSIQVTKD